MSEIDGKKDGKKVVDQPAEGVAASGEVNPKKSKKTAAAPVEQPASEEDDQGTTALRPDSDEIGK